MKDLDELIIEMDKIAENQTAAELSDSEKKELLAMLDFSGKPAEPDPPAHRHHHIPCSTIVDFQNCIEVPNNISVLPQAREFIFQSCLTCVTGQPTTIPITVPGCDTVNATLYPIKIVGCIQYIAVADVIFSGGCYIKTNNNTRTSQSICPTDPPVSSTTGVSAAGCVCVDTVVGYTSNASSVSNAIPCSSISVCLNPFTVDAFGKISFSGKFLLPSITNCGSIPPCSPTACPV